jgi:hypothetical protein
MSATLPIAASSRVMPEATASGGQTNFPYNFPILAAADLRVTRTRGPTTTVLSLNVDYTVTNAGVASGGDVVLSTGAIAGDKILIDGLAAIARLTNVTRDGKFRSAVTDAELDRQTIYHQEARRDIDTSLAALAAFEDIEGSAAAAIAAAAAALVSQNAAAASATTAQNGATAVSILAGISGTYATKAAMDAAASGIAANAIVLVVADETHSGFMAIWQKLAGVMTYLRIVPQIFSYTFATRPDPSPFAGLPGILITDERYGAQFCYSDGSRWRRCSDKRTAQSAVVNYYVDGTAGNDANAGTSSGAPIETLTQLKALVAALPSYRRSGLLIRHKRDTDIEGFWTLGTDNFACVFEAYGTESLPRPRFDCSDVLNNASFTVDGTYSNCHNITISPNIETNPAECPGVWVNGKRFAYVATKAECDAAPGTFTHPSASGQTSLVLTINPGSDPTSDGKIYRASMRSSAIDAVLADECEFRDLHGKRNYGSYGPFGLGNHAIAERLLCEDGNSHNIYFGAYSVLKDVEALNCNPGWLGSATMFIGFDNPVKPGAWARLERCIARCTENTMKAPSAITAVSASSPTTVTVSAGHKFAVGDYVTGDGVGGATWLNGVRWYVSGVSTNTLTLQKHSYSTNRVATFNSTGLDAWTSGGTIKLVPTVAVIGFYSHGPGNGTDVWSEIVYDHCEVHGCNVTFSAADVRKAVVIEPYCTQFTIGLDVSAYASMIAKGGKHDNTPAVVGAIASRSAAGGRIDIHRHKFIINSTGNHQIGAGCGLRLYDVEHVGFAKILRGLAGANPVVEMKRWINTPNANITQDDLFDFPGTVTGLSLTSDFGDFGGYAGDFIIEGSTHANLAAYQAATLQDLNSKA